MALCFVAVLAIALGTYVAVCARAMELSNRSFQSNLSLNLAEAGLEDAMRCFNNGNNFSGWTSGSTTVTWSTSGRTATGTLTFPSTKYSTSRVTGTAKMRVDKYAATTWSPTTAYTEGDLVWRTGRWYQCIKNHTNKPPPDTTNWVCTPTAWSATTYYAVNDMVVSNGTAYRCTTAHTNWAPPNASYWIAHTPGTWSPSTAYAIDDVVIANGTSYRCHKAHTNKAVSNSDHWASPPVIYAEGISTPATGDAATKTQLRAEVAPASLFPNAYGATNSSASIDFDSSGTVESYDHNVVTEWSAGTAYAVGDLVHYTTNGLTYRCISATSAGTPPTNTTFWSASLNGYSAVIAGPAFENASTTVRGYVTANTTSFGTTATVKGAGSPASPNVDPARVQSGYYVPQFDLTGVSGGTNLPAAAGSGTYLYEGANTLGTPGATSPSIYNITGTYESTWVQSGLYLDDSTDILTIDGPVILNVTGTLYTYYGKIIITANGSLEIYFTGQLYLGGSVAPVGGIQNLTRDPKKLFIASSSTTNSTNFHYHWSTIPLYGVIYMPNAALTTWSNINSYGAYSARTIYAPYAQSVRYDVSLRGAGTIGTFVEKPFQITSWRELTDPAEKVSL